MAEVLSSEAVWYGLLQGLVAAAFGVTAVRAWRHSRARFAELISAFLFGLLLEQGDIFLFGTYRYNENWILVGDVAVAIALTWALIIAGAMNLTDALGIRDAGSAEREGGTVRWLVRGLPAPMADAVWAILLDLAIDAIAIRLGLWTWTIRADEGWFGVPWGNFFAWIFVAFWFSFFTRLVRAERRRESLWARYGQWLVPVLAFVGLIGTLVPFVAVEHTAALPFVPDDEGGYQNGVWVVFVVTLGLFAAVTLWALVQKRKAREKTDHWLMLNRLGIHLLFLAALFVTGMYLDAPLLLVVALVMLAVELVIVWSQRRELADALRAMLELRKENVRARGSEAEPRL